jgi:hypothetical protein
MTIDTTDRGKDNDTEIVDYELVDHASYQCLECNKVHIKKYDPHIWWKKFDKERKEGVFVCPNCNIQCEAIPYFVEMEKPETAAAAGQIDTLIPLPPMPTEDEIDFVIQTIRKEAMYDEPSIKQLFFGMSTAFTRLGMGHKVNSKDSGAGKSYLTNKVAGYFPYKHVLILGGASNKAFQHKEGELVIKDEDGNYTPLQPQLDKLEDQADDMDEGPELKKLLKQIKALKRKGQKLIILDDTIIVIQDTPQDALLNNIMSLVSQDSERDQEYLFVNDKLQGTSNIIRGMPVIFYTRVLDDTHNNRAEEVFRRFVNISPNSTKEKTQEANRITSKRFGLLPEEYDEQIVSNTDKERAKEIIKNMVENLKAHTTYLAPKQSGVKILFEETISHAMPYHDVFQMTVNDRLIRYLSIITKVKMGSRPRLVHRVTGAFYPVPTFDDLKEAFTLMQTGGSNIRPYLVSMYNEVIFPLWSDIKEPRVDKDEYGNVLAREKEIGLTVKEIIDGAKEKLNVNVSKKDIHYKYLIPLAELGLINWAKSVFKGNEKIYYPADPESSKVHSLFPDDDLRLTVTDKSFYPYKEYLEQCYGFRSKLLLEHGGKNISDIYKVEDHEGNEITMSELIDTHLSNPELCFKIGWAEMEPFEHDLQSDLRDSELTALALTTQASRNTVYANQILTNHLSNFFSPHPLTTRLTKNHKNLLDDESDYIIPEFIRCPFRGCKFENISQDEIEHHFTYTHEATN